MGDCLWDLCLDKYTGDGRFDGEAFLGRLLIFFLGGRGRGRAGDRASTAASFSQDDARFQTAPFLCYILYIEQWKFRCSMSSGHRERGFLDPRTPWADACDVSGSDSPSTCSHSDDSRGADAFRSTTDSTEQWV